MSVALVWRDGVFGRDRGRGAASTPWGSGPDVPAAVSMPVAVAGVSAEFSVEGPLRCASLTCVVAAEAELGFALNVWRVGVVLVEVESVCVLCGL